MRKTSILLLFLFFGLFLSNSQTIRAEESQTTHTILVENNLFNPRELEIDIGDRVFFNWTEEAIGHNVAQTENSNSLEYLEDGFRSGDPTKGPMTWELPQQYLQENITIFYICEPHVSAGMRGLIIVGEGSTNLEETPISNLSFILGISSILLLRIVKNDKISIK